MIIVQETFVAKPGNASKLAKLFKESMSADKHFRQVMTDMTGQYNRVVALFEYNDMDEFNKSYQEMMNPPPEMKKAMEKMQGYTEMYQTGSREIFRTW